MSVAHERLVLATADLLRYKRTGRLAVLAELKAMARDAREDAKLGDEACSPASCRRLHARAGVLDRFIELIEAADEYAREGVRRVHALEAAGTLTAAVAATVEPLPPEADDADANADAEAEEENAHAAE